MHPTSLEVLLLLLALSLLPAQAYEGMWLPEQLPQLSEQLVEMGMVLPVDKLADPQGDVLGAVVSLGHCTASFVSENGLLLTNAHCVRGWLQDASVGDEDLVRDGFLAATPGDERWAGARARLLVTDHTEDVTDKVLSVQQPRMDDVARSAAIDRARHLLIDACEASDPTMACDVVSFHDGLRWRLVARREIPDVRIVYVPSDGVATFGGDQDNWMWPRHTGDFAFIRAYVAPNGQPAEHADTNVAYKPAHHLRIDPTGVSPDDFVMIAGFPAETYRYRTAAEAKHAAMLRYPEGVQLFTSIIDTLRTYALTDRTAARKLDNLLFSFSNRRKNYQGMADAFAHLDLASKRAADEAALMDWVNADRKRTRTYGPAITELHEQIAAHQGSWHIDRLVSLTSHYPLLVGAARTAYRYALEQDKPVSQRRAGYQPRDARRIAARFQTMQNSLFMPAEHDAMKVLFSHYVTLPEDQHIPPLDAWIADKGGVDSAVERLFDDPPIADPTIRSNLLHSSAEELRASADPWMQLAVAVESWVDSRQQAEDAYQGAMARLRPVYMQALMEMRGGPIYPDANRTLRVSFGRVKGYSPAEAIQYAPMTTVRGMAAKAGHPPFYAPPKLLIQIAQTGRSRWASPALGTVPLNFIATLDNTGGSSGSPTLNARGELVGLAFDRNYEAMASDWMFDPDLTRSIQVDIRFALWMLSDVADGQRILEELKVL